MSTHHTFDTAAQYYDLFELKSQPMYANIMNILETHFTRHRVTSVLDFACGTGAQAIPLARKGYHVTACDISTELLHVAPIRKLTHLDMKVQLGMKNDNIGWPNSGWWMAGGQFPPSYWNFRYSHLSNEQFLMLGDLEHLESLLIYSDRLTDSGMNVDNRFRKLKSLSIYGSSLTSQALAKLQRALPNCEIENEVGDLPAIDRLESANETN